MFSTRVHDLTRRTVLGAALSGLALSGTVRTGRAGGLSIGIGPWSTDDLKNIASILKGLSLDEDDEIRLGETYYQPILAVQGGAYASRTVQQAIKAFAAPLFATSRRSAFSWDITIVDNDTINAWALPGGKVAVNKGLLRYAASEHELAAVIAHEIGHAELSHAIAEMKKKSFVDGLSGVTQKALVTELKGDTATAASLGVGALRGPLTRLVTSGYARKSEYAADQHIVAIFRETGFDLREGANFYRTLMRTAPKKPKGTTSLFAGHPETRKRLEALLKAAPEAASPPDSSGTAPLSETPASQYSRTAFLRLKETFPTRRFYKFRET